MNNGRKTSLASALALSISVLLVSGCGGGSSSSSDDAESANTVVSRGVVTGFGSVYVNGTRYHTGGTNFRIDDNPGAESDLRVGMIVTVKGSKSNDGMSGSASHIEYDNEIKGPVSAITPDPLDATRKILTILAQSVEVNANTTIDDDGGLTFDTIQLDQVLEVSAYQTTSGLVATHIELQPDDLEIEIKGEIENLGANSFEIRGFPVNYDPATTQLDDIAMLENDLFVEVKGQLNGAGTILIASKIEGEDHGLDGGMDDAEVQGAIYDYNPANKTFKILGQAVDARRAILYPSTLVLDNDLIVEAEGHIVDNVLIADEIEQKGKKIKIYATLSAVGADTVSFNFNDTDIVARVNHQTEIEDDITDTDIGLAQLNRDDFVELEAFDDGSGVINAVEIERKTADEVRIVAPVTIWDEINEKVVLLGVEFDLSAATYENELDQSIPAATFYGSLAVGEFIKIKDADANGVFEKAELDD